MICLNTNHKYIYQNDNNSTANSCSWRDKWQMTKQNIHHYGKEIIGNNLICRKPVFCYPRIDHKRSTRFPVAKETACFKEAPGFLWRSRSWATGLAISFLQTFWTGSWSISSRRSFFSSSHTTTIKHIWYDHSSFHFPNICSNCFECKDQRSHLVLTPGKNVTHGQLKTLIYSVLDFGRWLYFL